MLRTRSLAPMNVCGSWAADGLNSNDAFGFELCESGFADREML